MLPAPSYIPAQGRKLTLVSLDRSWPRRCRIGLTEARVPSRSASRVAWHASLDAAPVTRSVNGTQPLRPAADTACMTIGQVQCVR